MTIFRFDLNANINDTIYQLTKKLTASKDHFIIDSGYLHDIRTTDFTGPNIKRNEVFQKKIILFMKKIMEQIFSGNDPDELTIPTTEFKKAFDTSNYTVAKEFLMSIGFMKRNVLKYDSESGKTSYYQAPYDGLPGICTSYRIQMFRRFTTQFSLVSFPTEKLKKNVYQRFNVDVSKKFKKTLQKTKLDMKNALVAEYEYFRNNTDANRIQSFYKRINNILSFGQKIYTTRGPKSKRVFHNLSNISSVSRKYLTFQGEGFNNIDLKNSQLVFLISYCKNNGLDLDQQFIEDVCSGVIYNRFYNANIDQREYSNKASIRIVYNIGVNRKKVKEQLFSAIFFDFKHHYTMNEMFKEMYPVAWETIRTIHKQFKNDDNCNLSVLLQNEEYALFEGIEMKMKSKGFFNLFDSIYYTDEIDTIMIINHIKQHFQSIGIGKFSYTINE